MIPAEARCQKQVMDPGGWRTTQCARRAVAGGLCTQHGPEAVEARERKSREAWDRRMRRASAPFDALKKCGFELNDAIFALAAERRSHLKTAEAYLAELRSEREIAAGVWSSCEVEGPRVERLVAKLKKGVSGA